MTMKMIIMDGDKRGVDSQMPLCHTLKDYPAVVGALIGLLAALFITSLNG